jgi:uncharacterized protein (TIGR03086 family)
LPTPCEPWNVKELVAHVVLGEAHLPSVTSGLTTQTRTEFGADLLGTNPLATWRGTALRAIETAREPGLVDAIFDLDIGAVTGTQLLNYRITDNIVHAWDVSVAVTRTAPIADRFAEWLLDFWQPVAAQISDTGLFGPPVEPAANASAGDRLLALLGRTVPPGE